MGNKPRVSVVPPRGFRFAGVACGIKASGAADVALAVADTPCPTAAVFTQNQFAAAPVQLSREILRHNGGQAQFVITNSGNANAGTGDSGLADADVMLEQTAAAIASEPTLGVVASTGVIGVPLPMARVRAGISDAAEALTKSGFAAFSQAILTTDSGPKTASRQLGETRIIGCTKGAGMIMPNMATTLSYVFTDAKIDAKALRTCLIEATASTYNRISIDGDQSTNDMIVVMASGASPTPTSTQDFQVALRDVLDELARKLISDGEGVHHLVEVKVTGAQDDVSGQRIAQEIATSSLVKAAVYGHDPNWGRILMAVGNAGVPVDEKSISIAIGKHLLFKNGAPVPFSEEAVSKAMDQDAFPIHVELGLGQGRGEYLTSDLSHEYVEINSAYRT